LPTIFIYDAYEGGIGIAEKCYEIFPELTKATLELVRDCQCKEGCPSCIYSPKCGNKNKPLDKAVAREILEKITAIHEIKNEK
jgi:DEAD/DEAH box helicase domain-containing protein